MYVQSLENIYEHGRRSPVTLLYEFLKTALSYILKSGISENVLANRVIFFWMSV